MMLEKLEMTPRPPRNFNGRAFRELERDGAARAEKMTGMNARLQRCNGERARKGSQGRDREKERERERERDK